MSAFSWTSIAKTKVSQHPVSLIQCGPPSQFVFELVSRDCQPLLPLLLSFSLFTSLFIILLLYHTNTLRAFICCPSSAHVTVLPGTPCEPPWIRDVTLLFCSLLFLPFSLLTLATERRVLVCSCCFFDTFTPAPRFAAEEWGLEVKQVWLTS